MSATISLIIADDHTLFIDGLKLLLKDEPDLRVVDIANDGKELLSLLPNNKADIVLLDINMPNLNGLDAARFVKQSFPALKIIMLSTYNDGHLVEKAKALGAHGYLLKTTNKEELLQTIRLVAAGQACFPYRQPLAKNEFDDNDTFLKKFNMTKRELEILQLIKTESTNQQIADKLFLSIYTIETHRKNIMQKLNLKSPVALHKFIADNNI
jgi:two-component system, NarL family, nitrate/nitrite response regulator NarL